MACFELLCVTCMRSVCLSVQFTRDVGRNPHHVVHDAVMEAVDAAWDAKEGRQHQRHEAVERRPFAFEERSVGRIVQSKKKPLQICRKAGCQVSCAQDVPCKGWQAGGHAEQGRCGRSCRAADVEQQQKQGFVPRITQATPEEWSPLGRGPEQKLAPLG